MNTKDNANNDRLRELVQGAGLSQPEALAQFNRKLKLRPASESAWKIYFCAPETTLHRSFTNELLSNAEKVFGPLQNSA
ncbi:hypothetical protein [Comamonas thiooxydans]|uniref:hypothetical protein n=1 Tax=Comamonas thiooxydans TaxID=363952 RepID=UPI001038CEEF|nr:hypothetical protein [Comamonas thiooxydans]